MSRKMLVADYDGTLKSNMKNLKLNIDAIKKFREQGNIFAISTTRSYDSIKRECDKYNIKYDFLNCTSGSVLCDENDNVIFKEALSRADLLALCTTLHHNTGYKDVTFYGAKSKLDYSVNKVKQGVEDDIVEMCITKKLINHMKAYKNSFKECYPNLKFSNFQNMIFIKNDFNKAMGINELYDYLNGEIDHDDIITVGNDRNDLELLKEYDGYKMLSSYPTLYGQGLKTTREVHTLVKKIIK